MRDDERSDPGLRALQFGTGTAANGALDQLFFTAGPNGGERACSGASARYSKTHTFTLSTTQP